MIPMELPESIRTVSNIIQEALSAKFVVASCHRQQKLSFNRGKDFKRIFHNESKSTSRLYFEFIHFYSIAITTKL